MTIRETAEGVVEENVEHTYFIGFDNDTVIYVGLVD